LIANGVAKGGVLNTVNVAREDPVQPGLLFAGTERTVFVSFDAGGSWQPLDNGLPPTSVRDIDIHGDDLVIATHGRGFYILDDIAALRALVSDARDGARLFPATAIRFRSVGFTGTPMPKDEPMAPNPPNGAIIDYVVPQHVRGSVQLAILDASGATLRGFSSTTRAAPTDASTSKIAAEWIEKAPVLQTSPGQHRFAWDMHYEAPAGLSGGERQEKGVWAPPGHYTVVLTVNGESFREPLELKPDPRVTARAADYARSFALARRVEAERLDVRKAVRDAEKLHAKLTKAIAQASAQQRSVLATLDRRLMQIAGLVADEPRWVSPEPEHEWGTLYELSADLDNLASAVDGADGAPSPDAEHGFAARQATLASALKTWNALRPQIGTGLRSR
jgi:hypothetical protein